MDRWDSGHCCRDSLFRWNRPGPAGLRATTEKEEKAAGHVGWFWSEFDAKDRRTSELDGAPLNELTGASRPVDSDPSHGISELEGGGLSARNGESNAQPRVIRDK